MLPDPASFRTQVLIPIIGPIQFGYRRACTSAMLKKLAVLQHIYDVALL